MGISVELMALCLAAPMIVMLFFLKGNERFFMLFLIIGFAVAAFAGYANNWVFSLIADATREEYSSYYAPVVEELLKAVPVFVLYGITRKADWQLVKAGITVGVGFAVLENVYYIATNLSKVSQIQWIFARGFATGVMHAVCTAAVAYMLTAAYQHRKMYVCGTIASLALAMTYHSIYNIMVKTDYMYIILFMPIGTLILVLLVINRKKIGKLLS